MTLISGQGLIRLSGTCKIQLNNNWDAMSLELGFILDFSAETSGILSLSTILAILECTLSF